MSWHLIIRISASDKPDGGIFGSAQQLRELRSVVEALELRSDHPGRSRERGKDANLDGHLGLCPSLIVKERLTLPLTLYKSTGTQPHYLRENAFG